MSHETERVIERAGVLLARRAAAHDESHEQSGPHSGRERAAGSEHKSGDRRPMGIENRPSGQLSDFMAPTYSAAVGIVESEDVSPRYILRALRRYKFTLIGSTLLFILVAAVGIFMITPLYVSEALVVVGNREATVPQPKTDPSAFRPLADTATVQTEMEILRSRSLAAQVVNELKLSERSEFNPKLPVGRRSGAFQRAIETVEGWIATPSAWARIFAARYLRGENPDSAVVADDRSSEENMAVDIFLSKLNVFVKTNSRIIAVQLEDRDPQLAAGAVNALVDHYISNHLVTTSHSTDNAMNWLDQTVADLRKRVAQSDEAYQQFRASFEADGGREFLEKRKTETSLQLTKAEADRKEAETRLSQLKALLGRNVDDLATSAVGASLVMQKLRERAAELRGQLAELSVSLGEGHPKLQTHKAAVAKSNQEMRAEVARLVTSLEGDLRVTAAREQSLRQDLVAVSDKIAQSSDGQKKMESLKAEALSDRAALDAFLTRRTEALGVSAKPPERIDAEIVSHAAVPQAPAKPKRALLLGLAVVGSTMAGLGITFAREKRDQTFRSGQEVEMETGARALGMIPLVRSRGSPQDEVLASSGSFYGEAIRTLYMTLLLQQRFKMVVVTSARPDEGKTTLATSLALMAARSGRKVLLVDADLCTAGASKFFGLAGQDGFAELIVAERQFSEVVATEGPTPNFHFLTSGAPDNALAARSALDSVRGLCCLLRDEYDLVVIDSPPVLAVPDAMVLAAHADATLFAVRWDATPQAAVKLGLRRLLASGNSASLPGIVLTMVNAREHSRYGYADSEFYAKELVSYYSST
jgi:polysaccharide biosynthesis transport protein